MKIKITSLALLLSSFFYSQTSNTLSRNDAGSPTVISGFYESWDPVNYPTGASSWWHLLDVRHHNAENNYGMQFSGSFFDQDLYFRKTNNSPTTGWSKIVMEDPSGVIYLKNRANVPDAGIKIQFTNFGDSWYGPYIRSSLDNANGPSSRMALKLGSYWEGEKNELTLINGNVGIGTSSPGSTLDIRGNFRVESNGNVFAYAGGADLILKAPSRGDNGNGRALVHDEGNVLTINYGGDFTGGIKIAGNTLIKNNGDAAFQGKVEAKEIKVTQTPTADFVFEDNYGLPELRKVENFIKENKHLPEIASAKEMEKDGVNVGEFQIKLLQKIEELTLYSIEQDKVNKAQEEKIEKLEKLVQGLLSYKK